METRGERRKRWAQVNELRKLLPNPHDDTPLDLALTNALRADTGRIPALGCSWCHDLPWRRRRRGCPGCGLPYAEERVAHEIPALRSSFPEVP